MLKSVEGVYRDGKIELLEPGPAGESRVIVTFLADGPVDLAQHGVDAEQAREMRWRLQAFTEDWDRPEMDVYNDPEPR